MDLVELDQPRVYTNQHEHEGSFRTSPDLMREFSVEGDHFFTSFTTIYQYMCVKISRSRSHSWLEVSGMLSISVIDLMMMRISRDHQILSSCGTEVDPLL